MAAPDWRALSVVLNDRAAIYAESFPAALTTGGPELVEEFTHQAATDLLYTFAGAWPTLGRDVREPANRFVYQALGKRGVSIPRRRAGAPEPSSSTTSSSCDGKTTTREVTKR